jgi:hypothetical protein
MINASFVAASPINAQAAAASAPVNNSLANVFRKKTPDSVTKSASALLTAGVATAIAEADKLVASYGTLKVEVLDRSDRALWALLQQVYAFALGVDGSPLKRETRTELINQIRLRGGPNTSTSASSAALVVRYIFTDVSRQTWSNYSIAMEKAAALGVTPDTFAAFLEQYGGVSKVVEMVFDHEQEALDANVLTTKQIREEKQSRAELMERLYNAMAHATPDLIDFSGELSNWVPEKPKNAAKADGKDDKHDPKYDAGQYVLFVTVRDPETGKYRVVQGNVFDRAFERQLLGTIVERMGAGTDELEQAVAGLEQSIGFSAAE